MTVCTTEPCDAAATTTVTFPRSVVSTQNAYCEECLSDLEAAGVELAVVDPDE